MAVDREGPGPAPPVPGLCDVSTLGKIEVFGKDAAEFLNRLYSNAFLKPSRRQGPLRPDAQGRRDGL